MALPISTAGNYWNNQCGDFSEYSPSLREIEELHVAIQEYAPDLKRRIDSDRFRQYSLAAKRSFFVKFLQVFNAAPSHRVRLELAACGLDLAWEHTTPNSKDAAVALAFLKHKDLSNEPQLVLDSLLIALGIEVDPQIAREMLQLPVLQGPLEEDETFKRVVKASLCFGKIDIVETIMNLSAFQALDFDHWSGLCEPEFRYVIDAFLESPCFIMESREPFFVELLNLLCKLPKTQSSVTPAHIVAGVYSASVTKDDAQVERFMSMKGFLVSNYREGEHSFPFNPKLQGYCWPKDPSAFNPRLQGCCWPKDPSCRVQRMSSDAWDRCYEFQSYWLIGAYVALSERNASLAQILENSDPFKRITPDRFTSYLLPDNTTAQSTTDFMFNDLLKRCPEDSRQEIMNQRLARLAKY